MPLEFKIVINKDGKISYTPTYGEINNYETTICDMVFNGLKCDKDLINHITKLKESLIEYEKIIGNHPKHDYLA